MAESVVQLAYTCTGVFSHRSIMWRETASKRQGWTWHCAVQVHTEDPGSFLSRSPRWDSPLALQSLDTHFPHSSARNTGCFFSHFQYCCSCSTLRLRGGGKVTREKRKKTRQWDSYPCAVTSASFGSFLHSTSLCLLFSLQVILYFAQNFRSVREVGYMWMEFLCHANNKTSKKVHKFYIEKLLSFHQEFRILVFFFKRSILLKIYIYICMYVCMYVCMYIKWLRW